MADEYVAHKIENLNYDINDGIKAITSLLADILVELRAINKNTSPPEVRPLHGGMLQSA